MEDFQLRLPDHPQLSGCGLSAVHPAAQIAPGDDSLRSDVGPAIVRDYRCVLVLIHHVPSQVLHLNQLTEEKAAGGGGPGDLLYDQISISVLMNLRVTLF